MSNPENAVVPEATEYRRQKTRAGKVPIGTTIFQGLGALPGAHKDFAFNTFLLLYYSQILGVPASSASVVLAIALVVDDTGGTHNRDTASWYRLVVPPGGTASGNQRTGARSAYCRSITGSSPTVETGSEWKVGHRYFRCRGRIHAGFPEHLREAFVREEFWKHSAPGRGPPKESHTKLFMSMSGVEERYVEPFADARSTSSEADPGDHSPSQRVPDRSTGLPARTIDLFRYQECHRLAL